MLNNDGSLQQKEGERRTRREGKERRRQIVRKQRRESGRAEDRRGDVMKKMRRREKKVGKWKAREQMKDDRWGPLERGGKREWGRGGVAVRMIWACPQRTLTLHFSLSSWICVCACSFQALQIEIVLSATAASYEEADDRLLPQKGSTLCTLSTAFTVRVTKVCTWRLGCQGNCFTNIHQ